METGQQVSLDVPEWSRWLFALGHSHRGHLSSQTAKAVV